MSDGLTVPFALAAGLSGAVEATGIIITAGLAEVAAGAVAIGRGGYLAARTDAEHFATERARPGCTGSTATPSSRTRTGRPPSWRSCTRTPPASRPDSPARKSA